MTAGQIIAAGQQNTVGFQSRKTFHQRVVHRDRDRHKTAAGHKFPPADIQGFPDFRISSIRNQSLAEQYFFH